jgi:hypothetical protein
MTEMIQQAKKTLIHAIRQPDGTQTDYLEAQRHEANYQKGGFITLLTGALEALRKGRELDLIFKEAESRARYPSELQSTLQAIEMSGEVLEDPGDRFPVVIYGQTVDYIDKMDLVKIQELIGQYREGGKVNKGGRPEEFLVSDTRRWHNELAGKKEFQKKNGTPHITRIREEIMRRHQEKTGQSPTIDAIRKHYTKF